MKKFGGNDRIRESFIHLIVWLRCEAEDDDSRRVATKSGAPRAKQKPPYSNRGVVRNMKIKRIKKHVVHFKNAVESVQIRF